jgi:hypothetical protein
MESAVATLRDPVGQDTMETGRTNTGKIWEAAFSLYCILEPPRDLAPPLFITSLI